MIDPHQKRLARLEHRVDAIIEHLEIQVSDRPIDKVEAIQTLWKICDALGITAKSDKHAFEQIQPRLDQVIQAAKWNYQK